MLIKLFLIILIIRLSVNKNIFNINYDLNQNCLPITLLKAVDYKKVPKKYSIAKFLAVFKSLLTADSDIPK